VNRIYDFESLMSKSIIVIYLLNYIEDLYKTMAIYLIVYHNKYTSVFYSIFKR